MSAFPSVSSGFTPQHITIQSYNRERLFYEDADYHYFLCSLKTATDRHGCALHAYVLMPDHVQLLFSAREDDQAVRAVGYLEWQYTQYFNLHYRRLNRLLELDYSLVPVDADQHLLAYYRYIELVPVRVSLVADPGDYPWSSYGCNAMGEDVGLLAFHPVYLQLGAHERERRSHYRALFVEDRPGQVSTAVPLQA